MTSGNPRPFFGQLAERIVDNGFHVIAVIPNSKKPRHRKWVTSCFLPTDRRWVVEYALKYPNDSIGIPCGHCVVAMDIDVPDWELAAKIQSMAFDELGETPLVRVGQHPKRMLIYRPTEPLDTIRMGKVEMLGRGSQFVAFGMHPVTDRPYLWWDDDPADTDAQCLPPVGAPAVRRFLIGAGELIGRDVRIFSVPAAANDDDPLRTLARAKASVIVNPQGLVIDGREEFMRTLVWHEYRSGFTTPHELADRVWQRFVKHADLVRPKGSSPTRHYCYRDVLRKALAICRKRPDGYAKKGRALVSNLHRFRQPGFWLVERKARHQADAERRTITPSALIVNRAMLDAVPVEAGQCITTVRKLAECTGLAASTVKAARASLIDLGLWVAERGVWVPLTSELVDSKNTKVARVLSNEDPLYLGIDPLCSGKPRPSSNDNDEPDEDTQVA